MGCDIHMHYEVNRNGKWEFVDWKGKYIIGAYSDGEPKRDLDKMWNDPLYVGRNYDLFAVLANVRNGIGFAGCYTGEPFDPISDPRGLPTDVSEHVRKESDEYGEDGHSHSWLSLAEVLNYDYTKTRHASGVCNLEDFSTFVEKGKPSSWSADVMGRNVVKVKPEVMLRYHLNGYPQDGMSYYTRVEWKESYRDAIGSSWFATMQSLADQFGKPNDIRLVFWFDN